MKRASAALVAIVALLCAASCAPDPSADLRIQSPARRRQLIPVRKLGNARVYDGGGKARACGEPVPNCPARARNADFADQCRLHGYYLRRCGCEDFCSGKVLLERAHYDSLGHSKSCKPEARDCSPPETSAAFQDACTERGHRLVVCGCEWLCDGPLQE
jgi:hypothetical protein